MGRRRVLRGERVAGDELTHIVAVAGVQLNGCPVGRQAGPVGNVQANPVAFGLDQQKALEAITLQPAKFMGVADKLGSLDVGKSASLIVSEGDLLDPIGQSLTHMFIDGRSVSLESRHTELYNKYQEKPAN